MNTVWKVLTRKKILDSVTTEQTELGRVLNTFDLTALGVGSTLGVGVYVLAGQVAKETAGPSVVLSFLIAALASVFAGLCYAEFGARTPRAGSAYIYSYVCVGEFIAFVIGWNLILEYVIGSASVARGLSLYLDTLINDTLKDTFREITPIDVTFMSQYFDFFAFGISMLLAVALAFGMRESSLVNNIVTLLNLLVVIYVIIAGSINAHTENWNLPKPENMTDAGTGGFFPFGVEGMIKGAATCFYGFVGFDCIATTGEEVKNPRRAIPISIILSLFIIFLAYFGTSTVITLMVPYYNQDPNAPIPSAFEMIGWDVAKWIVAIGGIFGLCASLFGAMFPLPRIIYAMASDSLVFRFLGKVNPRFKTPVTGTLLAGLLTGLMAALFDLKQLVNMMSIGTLLAYTIVAASVLLLRYEVDKGDIHESLRALLDSEDSEEYTDNRGMEEYPGTSEETDLMSSDYASSSLWKQIFNCGRQECPTEISERIVKIEVFLYCVLCVLIGLCAMYLKKPISNGEIWAIVLTAIVICLTVLDVMSLATQPKSRKELSFKVPLVPLIPALSILVNIYLMLMLDSNTWIRFGVWMIIGIPTYYFSVQTHSDARNESISSKMQMPNGKLNGFANHGYIDDEHADVITNLDETSKKKQAPLPPTAQIESTIAVLDEILEEASIFNDRKFSVDSVSIASNVLREENVKADVHCADIPLTPVDVNEAPPLLQSSDVVASPSSEVSDVSPNAAILEIPSLDESNPPTNQETVIEPPPSPIELSPEGDGSNRISLEVDIINPETEVPDLVIPPPPPFMPESKETNNVFIPRPRFTASAFAGVKLKHYGGKSPAIPPVDYSRQNSEIPGLERRHSNDNIKFGSEEHKEFLEKLNQTLQQGYVPTQIVVDLSKTPSIKRTDSNIPNEDVIEDNINRNDAKEKLAQFLAKTPNFPLVPSQNGDLKKSEDNKEVSEEHKEPVVENNINEGDYKEQHKENMKNIFGSIKLRKVDSFRGDSIEEIEEPVEEDVEKKEEKVEDKPNDRIRHKENMDSIFKSIRLRKVDSFKASQE